MFFQFYNGDLKVHQHNENQIRANALSRFMMNNDMTEFWKDEKNNTMSL